MLGKDEDGGTKKPKHQSADDLNDGFVLDKDDRHLLSYKVSVCLCWSACSLNSKAQFPVSCLMGLSQVESVNL